MTDSPAGTPDPTDRPGTADEGSSVPPGSTEESQGGTPQTETYEAAQESLDAAEASEPDGASDAGAAGPSGAGEDESSDALSTQETSDAPAGAGDAPAAGSDAEGDDQDDDQDGDQDESESADEDSDDDDSGDEDDNPLDTEGEIAADYLEELLDIADLDGDIDTYVESERAHVSIVTEAELLVGPNGEVLEALQELSRLAVMTETGHRSRLMLDVAGYRDRRRKVLADLASDAVQEVQSSGGSVRLSAMNPFERKIGHDAVAAAGLTSESEGEEPGRRVVVLPAS